MLDIIWVIILELVITYLLITKWIVRVKQFDWGIIGLKYNKRVFPATYDHLLKPKKATIFISFKS